MDDWTSTSEAGAPAGGGTGRWEAAEGRQEAGDLTRRSQPARPLRAVALRYDPGRDAAPRVVASGERLMAQRIIDVAREHGVPLYCDPQLVDALMRVPLGAQIPPQAYMAVAEVLAFVYELDQGLASGEESKPAPGSSGPHPPQGSSSPHLPQG